MMTFREIHVLYGIGIWFNDTFFQTEQHEDNNLIILPIEVKYLHDINWAQVLEATKLWSE